MVPGDRFSDIDECANDPCFNGGTCSDLVNSFVCNCPPGYGGILCDAGMSTAVNYTVFIYFLLTSNHIIVYQQFFSCSSISCLRVINKRLNPVTHAEHDIRIFSLRFFNPRRLQFLGPVGFIQFGKVLLDRVNFSVTDAFLKISF